MATERQPASRKSIADLPASRTALEVENKENVTADVEVPGPSESSKLTANIPQRKTRSKSLGPGGTDALKEHTGNRRKSAAAPPKSILKPSIPLSPLQEIPLRKRESPVRKQDSPSKSPRGHSHSTAIANGGATRSSGSPVKRAPTSSPKPQAVVSPSKDSRKAAAHRDDVIVGGAGAADEEAKEQRRLEREVIEKQRETRRKSMANRRVSFAPEATLHTWDHVEDNQDSTTSSASADATRRASMWSTTSPNKESLSAGNKNQSPSAVSASVEEDETGSSLGDQRRVHQKQGLRKSSDITPISFNNPDETPSSSPATNSMRGNNMNFEGNISISEASTSQDAALEQEVVNHGDNDPQLVMNVAPEDAILTPEALVQLPNCVAFGAAMNTRQENINSVSPLSDRKPVSRRQSRRSFIHRDESDDMSMDITRAVGGIVQVQQAQGNIDRPDAILATRRQSFNERRQSSAGASVFGNDTMEFTTAVGGIQSNGANATDYGSLVDEDEELSMEFTSALGGIQCNNIPNVTGLGGFYPSSGPEYHLKQQQPTASDNSDDGCMEMTKVDGGIIPPSRTRETFKASSPENDASQDLLENDGPQASKYIVKNLFSSPMRSTGNRSPVATMVKASPYHHTSLAAKVTDVVAGGEVSNSSHTPPGEGALGPRCHETPTKATPSQLSKPTTPGKTPPSNNVSMRRPSPRRLFRDEIKRAKSSPLTKSPMNINAAAAANIPMRGTSGVGFDKHGLGSPQVAALLDRRASISDHADIFAPQDFASREVRFQDPRPIETEIMRERNDEIRRESGDFDTESYCNSPREEQDITATLREAIGSMTPRKNKPKVRKSLAVGTAKGLLGKRPAELDEEDENGTPKAIRGREPSPVKRIRLQGPPSALETTGRFCRPRHSFIQTSGNERPHTPMNNDEASIQVVSHSSHKEHLKNAEVSPSAQKSPSMLAEFERSDRAGNKRTQNEEKISLQGFLSLTNIRFMELNTTKRRHTVAPSAERDQRDKVDGKGQSQSKTFESAVVAGTCTLPMLEMYQHSCRELKKYISEGRKIVREIETDTSEENPALFREYTAASTSDRLIMDNQFKNMKAHARLLSKGMWYEWRMKLLESLKGVLISEAEGLEQDGRLLQDQQSNTQRMLPQLAKEHLELKTQCSALQDHAKELANCNQEELRSARQQILLASEQIWQRREQIERHKRQSTDLDQAIEAASEAKIDNVRAIIEAQKAVEEYRGWSLSEVTRHQRHLESLEAKHGWMITAASSSLVTLVYCDQLELSFDVGCFLSSSSSSEPKEKEAAPIALSYVGDKKKVQARPLTLEKSFLIRVMRAHLQGITQEKTRVKDLLDFVSAGWTHAHAIAEEIKGLNLECITECSLPEDGRLAILSRLLLTDVRTKLHIAFDVGVVAKDMKMTVKLKVRVDVIYGEEYKMEKMKDFLRSKIGEQLNNSANCSCVDAVRELRKRLLAQGKK